MEQLAGKLLAFGREQLKNAGISDWDYDSRTLLLWCCHVSRMDLFTDPSLTVKAEEAAAYESLIRRRAAHEPLQYLMGECEFMGLPFQVNPDVLIPRQDTEVLVELILEEELGAKADTSDKKIEKTRLLDVCCGSGCIAVSLQVLGGFLVEGLDLSSTALDTAREKAKRNQAQVHFFQSDMFSQVKEQYDIIVSNPPYIPSDVVDGLMPEVLDHEPRMALDGKEDGLYFYRILAKEGKEYLNPGGRLYLEIGYDQGQTVPALLKEEGFEKIRVKKDLAGHDRVVAAVFP